MQAVMICQHHYMVIEEEASHQDRRIVIYCHNHYMGAIIIVDGINNKHPLLRLDETTQVECVEANLVIENLKIYYYQGVCIK